MDVDDTKNLDQCRICLESVETMLNMFEEDSTTVKLALCCGVEILNIPTLPSNICKKCYDILNVAYDFRVLCQRSQEYLCDTQNCLDDDEQKPDYAEINLPSYSIAEDDQKYEDDTNYEDDAKYEDDDQSYDEDQQEDNTELVQSEHNENEHFEEFSSEQPDTNVDIKIKEEDKSETNFKARYTRKPKAKTIFMCNICGNIYKNKATFNYHMKLHQNDKKYECEICSKRFMQTCELRAHIRVHTGEKPFNCSYCDRKFRDRSGVTRHERTHTNERPYGCTICGTHFSYSATLKKHERVHTGEKPFKCMICIKQFSESHQLKAHLGTIRHREMARDKSKTMF